MQLTVGARFRSAVDETQVVVIRAPAEPIHITCGGHPVLPIASSSDPGLVVAPGHDGGTVVGKRYIDPESDLELLCTKAGVTALFVGDRPLTIKSAKPLPASD
jgi:hypothetical protein